MITAIITANVITVMKILITSPDREPVHDGDPREFLRASVHFGLNRRSTAVAELLEPGESPADASSGADESRKKLPVTASGFRLQLRKENNELDPEFKAAVSANRYALEYFGLALEDVADHHWIDIVHPDDRASVLAAWDASRATGQHYRHEHRLKLLNLNLGLPQRPPSPRDPKHRPDSSTPDPRVVPRMRIQCE